MRTQLSLLISAVVLATALCVTAALPVDKQAKPEVSSDATLLQTASDGLHMVRVTPAPQVMQQSVVTMCAPAPSVGIHDLHYFDVYVSQGDLGPMLSGKGTYPPGTVILKRKYGPTDNLGKTTELFTGMRKHEAGYDSTNGNWEYFVTTANGKIVPNTNTMSCISCHQSYEATDYVTRDYPRRQDLAPSPAK